MRRKGKHLTYTERLIIEKLYNSGSPRKQIAAVIGCHLDTIYREIRRGLYDHLNTDYTYTRRYSADIAQHDYDYKATAKGAPIKLGKDYALADRLEQRIMQGYSPAAALGEIYDESGAMPFCVTTLYSYIDKGVFSRLTNKHLPEKSRRKRSYNPVRRAKRPPKGETIEHRPKVINSRSEFGHWEMDTVHGKAKGSRQTALVLTERKTRFEIIVKLNDCSARSVVRSLDKIGCNPHLFKSITVDNGSEFSDCYGMEHDPRGNCRTKLYYCHPYCSSERGSNERQNRIIRRFFPKGQSLYRVTNAELQEVADWINHLPRKLFNYRCSADLFRECCAAENISWNFRNYT